MITELLLLVVHNACNANHHSVSEPIIMHLRVFHQVKVNVTWKVVVVFPQVKESAEEGEECMYSPLHTPPG